VILAVAAGVVFARSPRSGRRRATVRAALVAAIAWLPAIIDMFVPGGHNLYRVAKFFFASPSGQRHDLSSGLRVVLRETGVGASWMGGHLRLDAFTAAFDGGLGLLPGVGLIILAVAGVLAWRRIDRVVGSLVVLLSILLPAAVAEMGFGRGALFPYLFGWVTLVGLMCWVAGALVIVPRTATQRWIWTLDAVAVALAAVLLVIGVSAPLPRSPRERPEDASIVRRLVAAVEPHLSRSAAYQLVHGRDIFSSIYELGVVAQLRKDGYHVVVTPDAFVLFGRHMTDPRASTFAQLTVVAPYESTPAGQTLLALSDPLSPADRALEAQLVARLATAYEQAGSPAAADLVLHAEGDLVGLAAFAHPDPTLDPAVQQLVGLRKKGRSIAVLLQPAGT
jgi:hypothetical protein